MHNSGSWGSEEVSGKAISSGSLKDLGTSEFAVRLPESLMPTALLSSPSNRTYYWLALILPDLNV